MRWVAAARSIIGTSHEKSCLPCQDFSGYVKHGERLVLAIADGAGSAAFSEQGAKTAVEAVLGKMAQYEGALEDLTIEYTESLLNKVLEELKVIALASSSRLGDYATTLLGAIIDNDGAYFFQIGDGCWIADTDKGIECATWPVNGEYINETVFITSPNVAESITHAYVSGVTSVLGFTDGIEHLCLNHAAREPHLPVVEKLIRAVNSPSHPHDVEDALERFLTSELVNDRTDDDKTIILAWRASDEANVDG